MVFSIMLWAPSWGGMLNGLLTLRGAWHLLRTDPIIKFMVTAVTFYGMATFEGPLLSIKSVSGLAHYTDWIIGHVHGGALGWNGFLTFAMLYYLVPRMWKTELYSVKLATYHFWIGFLGIMAYYLSMVAAGITQGLMWRATTPDGRLMYPDFVETVARIVPLYWVRALGGVLYLSGFAIMGYNLYRTIKSAPALAPEKVTVVNTRDHQPSESGHRGLEGAATAFSVLTLIAVLVGSVIEILPMLSLHKYVPANVQIDPYTPLELAGRDIYIREGCYVCHSQQIRPIASEVLRYGKPSTIEESMYDHPFQWGSKRTGPDLARVGKKYPHLWHFRHMLDPRAVTPKSIMPSYGWLEGKDTDFVILRKKFQVLKNLGVPYSDEQVANADVMAEKQAKEIATALASEGGPAGLERKEIVAVIAYLQALGQKAKPEPASAGGN
jgi:cytochrome c oxidase cbb3-type subunit I/II